MEQRKLAEIEWADKRRQIDPDDEEALKKHCANMKYYSVVRRTTEYVNDWISRNCDGKDVFEMACGNGGYALKISEHARTCVAADIAPVTIQQAIERSVHDPHTKKIQYMVLDCEKTGLPDGSFDVVCEGGALHHMDLDSAYREAARLLRPGGKFLCVEAIRHNPVIQLYRRMTPNLRTRWEADHILGRREIMMGKKYFQDVSIRCFHMATIFAVPFRKTALFSPVLAVAEHVDNVLTSIPGFRWMAWQAVFEFSNPI
jgi:ubiquinone/menaquinone biosynthesis C-methylase UbiE